MPGVYFIAEAGVNHNGSLDLARLLVDQAAESGADAVKFQSFIATEVIRQLPQGRLPATAHACRREPAKDGPEIALDAEQHLELLQHCRSRRIDFLSTPFDFASVELLAQQLTALLKIASGRSPTPPCC